MIYSILYLVLAAVGLGVLVFIHELGHYFMAKKEGMKIEAFSIGFGKAIISWEKDGVKWKLCWIPVGGYVKIAGMEKKGSLEPYEIADGFYGKKPLARIKVALAGPLVNIVFAFVLFSAIWAFGGREKPFAFSTHLIGFVDPSSGLYKAGVRPGDEISSYGNKEFQGFTQFQTSALVDKDVQVLKGEMMSYEKGIKTPFVYRLDLGKNIQGKDKFFAMSHLMSPASYLIYRSDSITSDSPMKESGILPGDRIVWIDGELVFSRRELVSVVNEQRVLLTVQRGDSTFLTRVPRLQIEDLRVNYAGKADLHDWAYARNLKGEFSSLYFIPYAVTNGRQIEYAMSYVDESAFVQEAFQGDTGIPMEVPLEKGDVILAVDGRPVSSGEDILESIQKRHVQIIVQRGVMYSPVSSQEADQDFMKGISFADLQQLSSSIGAETRLACKGTLCLLAPVEPKPFASFGFTPSVQEKVSEDIAAQKKQLEGIKDSKEREQALKVFSQEQHRLLLGGIFEDRKVFYNPTPWTLFLGVFDEIQRTITALFSGYLSPKYMLGPVGIVGAMQQGWGIGIKEALFLVGMISMNLGFVNLLPIPVLDGGHICFAIYETVTKKRIKAKTMEKLIIPFIVLIILFFLYVTYNDIARIF